MQGGTSGNGSNLPRNMMEDTDLTGLISAAAVIPSRAKTATLIYFPARKDLFGHVGHVAWLVGPTYLSHAPDREALLHGLPEKEGDQFKNGIVTNSVRPFESHPKRRGIRVHNSRMPDIRLDREGLGRKMYLLHTDNLLNEAAMAAYGQFLHSAGWQFPYVLDTGMLHDNEGNAVSRVDRNNCVTMSLAIFAAGLRDLQVAPAFLSKHPAFRGVANCAPGTLQSLIGQRAFWEYVWVRDVKNLVRDFKVAQSAFLARSAPNRLLPPGLGR